MEPRNKLLFKINDSFIKSLFVVLLAMLFFISGVTFWHNTPNIMLIIIVVLTYLNYSTTRQLRGLYRCIFEKVDTRDSEQIFDLMKFCKSQGDPYLTNYYVHKVANFLPSSDPFGYDIKSAIFRLINEKGYPDYALLTFRSKLPPMTMENVFAGLNSLHNPFQMNNRYQANEVIRCLESARLLYGYEDLSSYIFSEMLARYITNGRVPVGLSAEDVLDYILCDKKYQYLHAQTLVILKKTNSLPSNP